MSDILMTLQQMSLFYAHFSLKKTDVCKALTDLFYELNFSSTNFEMTFRQLKGSNFHENLSILFSDIGPFGKYDRFKAFFINLNLSGLLQIDLEEFPNGDDEVHFPILSTNQIEDLGSKIEVIPSIQLAEVFLDRFLNDKDEDKKRVVCLKALYKNRSLKKYFAGKTPEKIYLQKQMEDSFVNNIGFAERSPLLSFTLHENWKSSFETFINALSSKLGVSEIPYVEDDLRCREDEVSTAVPSPNVSFEILKLYFKRNNVVDFGKLSSKEFCQSLGIDQSLVKENWKYIFPVFLQFLFRIEKTRAISDKHFAAHVPHFVIAFMKALGLSLDGIQVLETIKSLPTNWEDDGKGRWVIVCSSSATGLKCKKDCKFHHPTNKDTAEIGVITNTNGTVMVVTRHCSSNTTTAGCKNGPTCVLGHFCPNADLTKAWYKPSKMENSTKWKKSPKSQRTREGSEAKHHVSSEEPLIPCGGSEAYPYIVNEVREEPLIPCGGSSHCE